MPADRVWEKWVDGRHKAYATFPFIAAQGGLPIIIDGELIGSIGVSGVKAFEDEQIAMFAVKTVFPAPRLPGPVRRTTRRAKPIEADARLHGKRLPVRGLIREVRSVSDVMPARKRSIA